MIVLFLLLSNLLWPVEAWILIFLHLQVKYLSKNSSSPIKTSMSPFYLQVWAFFFPASVFFKVIAPAFVSFLSLSLWICLLGPWIYSPSLLHFFVMNYIFFCVCCVLNFSSTCSSKHPIFTSAVISFNSQFSENFLNVKIMLFQLFKAFKSVIWFASGSYRYLFVCIRCPLSQEIHFLKGCLPVMGVQLTLPFPGCWVPLGVLLHDSKVFFVVEVVFVIGNS